MFDLFAMLVRIILLAPIAKATPTAATGIQAPLKSSDESTETITSAEPVSCRIDRRLQKCRFLRRAQVAVALQASVSNLSQASALRRRSCEYRHYPIARSPSTSLRTCGTTMAVAPSSAKNGDGLNFLSTLPLSMNGSTVRKALRLNFWGVPAGGVPG